MLVKKKEVHKRSIISSIFGGDEDIKNLESSVRQGILVENANFAKLQDFSTSVVGQIGSITKWHQQNSINLKNHRNAQILLARRLHRQALRIKFLNLR